MIFGSRGTRRDWAESIVGRRYSPLVTDTRHVPRRRIVVASMVGTTIEFFDFYIYATASVLVFPRLFFPAADPATAFAWRSKSSPSLK